MVNYPTLRRVFHALVPGRVRRLPMVGWLAQRASRRFASHDQIYDESYYLRDVAGPAAQAAPVFTELIATEFQPRRVVDVGCGTGALLSALRARGCECLGLEYAEAGVRMCQAQGLDVRRFDLEHDVWEGPTGTFDVVVSMEVAEHLPEPSAEHYVDLLTSLAPAVVFTAATVGQGGLDHVNEQPHDYWIAQFAARGFRYEPERTHRWRRELETRGVAGFYSKNLMIFRRG